MSANFVIPYPPGFPIMVPGQVIEADTIEFMRKLDVKEIHGYDGTLGLKLLRPDALALLRALQEHPDFDSAFLNGWNEGREGVDISSTVRYVPGAAARRPR
mgnify:CR=1 FL=1